jgi:hypothetical protein
LWKKLAKGATLMTKDQKKFLGSKTEEDRTKKPYATPELVVHGAVDKLTGATFQGRQADGTYNLVQRSA